METVVLRFPGGDVLAEVAKTQEELARGLMGRDGLGEDEGMLFVFGPSWEGQASWYNHSFWMKNVSFPLDMIFIEGTQVVGLLENVPALSEQKRNIAVPWSYVLEVNAGWAQRHGVTRGQIVVSALWGV